MFFDCFSSEDLATWKMHSRVLDTDAIRWARRAMWAPSTIEKDGRYYFFFGATDIQNDEAVGGIGVAVGDQPSGPFRDHLGKPLIGEFQNSAQPIEQFVFRDSDVRYYLIYGGWRHCTMVCLDDSFTGFVPFENGTVSRKITSELLTYTGRQHASVFARGLRFRPRKKSSGRGVTSWPLAVLKG